MASNPYYVYSGAFIPGTLARSEQLATEYSNIQAGFAILAIQGVDSGAANAYVVTTNGGLSSYADGSIVEFKAANANTGSSTINVNGIGAVDIVQPSGALVGSGAIIVGAWYRLVYSTTYSAFILVAPITLSTTTNTISSAAPTFKVGLVASGGSSTACVPIDAKYAIDQSIAPTWTGAHIFANTVAFNSPVSFAGGLDLTGAANQYAATLDGSSSTGKSFGLEINAGTNASDSALLVSKQGGATQYFEIDGAGNVTVGNPTGGGLGVGTINAVGLYVNGVAVETAVAANPSASVGLSAVNGSAATYMRSDGAPALSQAIAPTWTAGHTFTPSSAVVPVTINAAVNQNGFVVNGGTNTSNTFLAEFITGQGNGFSSGLYLQAGTTSGDAALQVANAAGNQTYFLVRGDGALQGYGATAAGAVDMTPDSGSFAGTLTGFSGTVHVTCNWTRIGAQVTLHFTSVASTSTATTMTMTGLPAAIQPATLTSVCLCSAEDNTANCVAAALVTPGSGTISFYKTVFGGAWTSSGSKGLGNTTISYLLT